MYFSYNTGIKSRDGMVGLWDPKGTRTAIYLNGKIALIKWGHLLHQAWMTFHVQSTARLMLTCNHGCSSLPISWHRLLPSTLRIIPSMSTIWKWSNKVSSSLSRIRLNSIRIYRLTAFHNTLAILIYFLSLLGSLNSNQRSTMPLLHL